MQNDSIQITKTGFGSLQKELKGLKDAKRPKLVDRLSRARAEGDLKENSDYQNAKDELSLLDGRIEELEHVLKVAEVVKVRKDGTISVGTKVTVGVNGTKQVFHIVGDWEADPKEKKISHKSPLGQALAGKKVGEKVTVEAPAGKVIYTVHKIE